MSPRARPLPTRSWQMPKASAAEDKRLFGMGTAIVCGPGAVPNLMTHPDANPRCTCAVKAGRYVGNHHAPKCGAYKAHTCELAKLETRLEEISKASKASGGHAAAAATLSASAAAASN